MHRDLQDHGASLQTFPLKQLKHCGGPQTSFVKGGESKSSLDPRLRVDAVSQMVDPTGTELLLPKDV